MASDIARQIADDILENRTDPAAKVSSNTYTTALLEENNSFMQSSVSSYTLADDRSQFSREVDRWMAGQHITSTENAAVQPSRAVMVQRSVPARSSTLPQRPGVVSTGTWYILAMMLPILSVNPGPHWSYSPRMLLNTAEYCLSHLSWACGQARARIRHLAQDQISRELFATAMDIVLVIYAMGFLVLSMYQASIFG